MEIPTYVTIIGNTDIRSCINKRYDLGKKVITDMWHQPKDKMTLEDIFHETLYKCIKALDGKKMQEEEIHKYFFKAFRINMIRYYGYSYNKLTSGKEVETMVIPVANEDKLYDHIDGFQMIELVEKIYGKEISEMLWHQLQGHTYEYMDKKYNTNTFYTLSKVKQFLKNYYKGNTSKLIIPNIK